jgi:hypothetical protein
MDRLYRFAGGAAFHFSSFFGARWGLTLAGIGIYSLRAFLETLEW